MSPARLLAILILLGSARADPDDGVSFRGSLHLSLRSDRNVPDETVRYDPAANELTFASYLAPGPQDSFGSLLASMTLVGRALDGDLLGVLTADTGEVRSQRLHVVGQVCWSERTPSGLAVPGSGLCDLYRLSTQTYGRVIVPVEETTLESQPQVTSNGQPFKQEVDETLLLREAYVRYRFGRAGFASIAVGSERRVVADGYIHDDYGWGVQLSADLGALGPPLSLSASLFLPTRDLPRASNLSAPMVLVTADFLPSLFDRAGLFAAGLRENGDSLSGASQGALEERLVQVADASAPGMPAYRRASQVLAAFSQAPFSGEGTVFWLGTSGRVRAGRSEWISWTAALEGGQIDKVTAGQNPVVLAERVSLQGELVALHYEADLPRGLGARASFLYLSGDEIPRARLDATGIVPATGTYRTFLGVSPYLTETNIFFDGGLSESYADREARPPGVNGRGVISPGLSFQWTPADALSLGAKGAWLRAVTAGPFGGLVYGTELDSDLTFEAAGWLSLGVEADVLFPGDFFPSRKPITRGILALDLMTP